MRTSQKRPSGFTGIALFIGGLLAIAVIGILLSSAMQAGGWMFIGFVIGLVVLAALSAWLASFIVRQYVTWTETRVKAREAQNNFTLSLLKAGYQPDDCGGFKPIQQIAAPKVAQTQDKAQADPRHALLVSLCLMTIRAEGYGPTSKRLLSCDDAQDISSNRGGEFAKRDKWDAASKYGQEIGWLYTQNGGLADEQGLKIKIDSKACTVTDLLEALHKRNLIRDSAVNALPGVVR